MLFVENHEEVLAQIEKDLKRTQIGSEEYERMCRCYTELQELEMKREKLEADIQNQDQKNKEDREFKEQQLKKDYIDIILKYGTNIVTTIMSAGFGYGLIKFVLHFEEEGSVRSFGGRTGVTKVIQSALLWMFKK